MQATCRFPQYMMTVILFVQLVERLSFDGVLILKQIRRLELARRCGRHQETIIKSADPEPDRLLRRDSF
jgi:hypothetical protein